MGTCVLETFKEFTFEAAHRSPPFEGLHGHSFKVQVVFKGPPHPIFGWSHNLYDIDKPLQAVRSRLDHKFLNEVEGLTYPTLENVTRWIYHQLESEIEGLDRVILTRGRDGDVEGCCYSGAA